MIVQVIPLRRMPLQLPVLDYHVPEHLAHIIAPGQLVRIPFRKTEIFGLIDTIVSASESSGPSLKNINDVVFQPSLLSTQQRTFLHDIASLYHTPLGFIAKTNVLPLQKQKLKRLQLNPFPARKTASTSAHKPHVLLHHTAVEERHIINSLVEHHTGQSLCLTPDISSAYNRMNSLTPALQAQALLITSELSEKELFTAWLQLYNGERRIVVGTRRALFLPWFDLQAVIVDDEGNSFHKSWDMAPRLHNRDAALLLAHHHRSAIYFLAHTPSVETFFFATKGIYEQDSRQAISALSNDRTEIINTANEKRGLEPFVISTFILEKLKQHRQGDVFLFLNRRGVMRYVVCRDCRAIPRCPHCNRALTLYRNEVRCHYCQYQASLPQRCPMCRGNTIIGRGIGTEFLEEYLKKNLPHLPIVRIDSDTNPPALPQKMPSAQTTNVIIGTQYAWPWVNWRNTTLMAFLDADGMLALPEYKTAENLFHCIRDAHYRLPESATILIETTHPEHPVFQSLTQPSAFYTQQLAERRLLGYPPYTFLLKLYGGHTHKHISATQAYKVYQGLRQLTRDNPEIVVTEPFETDPAFYHKQWWHAVVVKIPYNRYKHYTRTIAVSLPDTWKVDPNPNTLVYFS